MWANIFRCAVERSVLHQGTDRYDREFTTIVLALQKGEQFWKELL